MVQQHNTKFVKQGKYPQYAKAKFGIRSVSSVSLLDSHENSPDQAYHIRNLLTVHNMLKDDELTPQTLIFCPRMRLVVKLIC